MKFKAPKGVDEKALHKAVRHPLLRMSDEEIDEYISTASPVETKQAVAELAKLVRRLVRHTAKSSRVSQR